MNRLMRTGIGFAIFALVLGAGVTILNGTSQASVNGVPVKHEVGFFSPGVVVLLAIGAVLFLLGLLRKSDRP